MQAAGLATGLMAALFARTDKSFRMRLSAALSQSTGVVVDDLLRWSLLRLRLCLTQLLCRKRLPQGSAGTET